MSDHKYGPHSNEQDFTLLYTQAQLDAMVARERALERERCAKIAETTGFGFGDSPENAPPYTAHGLALRIRSGK